MLGLRDINQSNFEIKALETFRFQYQYNSIYKAFCDSIHINVNNIVSLIDIPFLPIQFYKTHPVICSQTIPKLFFESSGTSDIANPSKHYFLNTKEYEESIVSGFQQFFSDKKYTIVGLLPHYLERPNSSLVYMVKHWMKMNQQEEYFFLNDFENLTKCFEQNMNQNILLIGISFALLDFGEFISKHSKLNIQNLTFKIIETGGMKGKYPELLKIELFDKLKVSFPKATIISEYGMCELFSQCYSDKHAIFSSPPWMKVLVSDINEPLSSAYEGSGKAKIIDLANRESCSFIETQDLIRLYPNGQFEILGRVDNADMRGCSMLYN